MYLRVTAHCQSPHPRSHDRHCHQTLCYRVSPGRTARVCVCLRRSPPLHPSPRSSCCYDHPARRAVPTARIAGGRWGGGGGHVYKLVNHRGPPAAHGLSLVSIHSTTAVRFRDDSSGRPRGVINTVLSRGKLARARHLQPSLQAAAGTVPAALTVYLASPHTGAHHILAGHSDPSLPPHPSSTHLDHIGRDDKQGG